MGSMGCSSSNDVVDKHPVISEDDAWDIALLWRDQLRGCVRLELANDEISVSSIITSFEWVTFIFHGALCEGHQPIKDPINAAAYARAATTAWSALSSCKGYSGVENPQFWKRVYYELLYPANLPNHQDRSYWPPTPTLLPITDAIRFFDHPDRPFPRIRLSLRGHVDDATVASVLLGRVVQKDEERDAKLQRVLAKLEPFMRKSDVTRSVPVQLELYNLPTGKHFALLRNILSAGELETSAPGTVSMVSMVEFHHLYLQSLKLTNKYTLDVHSLHSLMPPSDVKVLVGGRLSMFVRDHQLSRGLLDQLQCDPSVKGNRPWRVTHVDVSDTKEQAYSNLGIICSALPHLQSVQLLELSTCRRFYGMLNSIASDCTWLGYAIFHPDTESTSGLTSLEVDLDAITPVDIADLTKMAIGNNLLGNGNTGYLEGRIRSGTQAITREVGYDESARYTFPSEARVALNVSTLEALDNQGLVCVVIPGFGCGWIRHDDIVETRRRRAGASCVQTLRVKNYTEDPVGDSKLEILLGLLRVLGSRLTSLQFENSNHTSASSVHAILRLCPSLKSLRIHHDGSFWADETLVMEMPRLEELELTVHGRYYLVRPLVAYLAQEARYRRYGAPRPRREWETGPVRPLQELKPSCLPYLKALHVISARDGAYEQHESVLVSFLSQQPGLQYLHWSRGGDPSKEWADVQAQRVKEDTCTFLARLPPECHISRIPFRLDCRVAFLSVVCDNVVQSSSIGQLGKDVVVRIFQYATSSSRREIVVNQHLEDTTSS